MFLDTVLKVYVPTQLFVARQVELFVKRTEGASGIEYAIIAGMCAVVIAGFMAPIAEYVKATFTTISTALKPVAATTP